MNTRSLVLVCLFLATLLAGACVPAGTPTPQSVPTQGNIEATPDEILPTALATPYARQPAAGICGGPLPGETARVEIWPDMPEPRCLKIGPGQRVQVTNRTESAVQITLGDFDVSVSPGEGHLIELPVGIYLAPGVHLMGASPYSGPELWLDE